MNYQLTDPIGIGLRHTHFPEMAFENLSAYFAFTGFAKGAFNG